MASTRRIAHLLSVWMIAAAGSALAGANPSFTIPLHAKISQFESCTGYLPVDCMGVHPTVQVEEGQYVVIFPLVANTTQLAGIQTAFEVNSNWTYLFGLWDCQNGISDVPPHPPFGPVSGTLSYAFNCVTGGGLVPIGRMFLLTSTTGCVGQVESAFPFGTHAGDCQGEIDQIFPSDPGQFRRLGKVCVGLGGVDACDRVTPVATSTWGRIKATYPEGRR